MAGDGYKLPFNSGSFDLVCEFAVLHHVAEANRVVTEMSRVASKMICISDGHFVGQGPSWFELLKLTIYTTGLWPANWIKTRGRGYTYSEHDGIAYSYSVYESLATLRRFWSDIRIIRTSSPGNSGWATILSAPHVLVVGMARKSAYR